MKVSGVDSHLGAGFTVNKKAKNKQLQNSGQPVSVGIQSPNFSGTKNVSLNQMAIKRKAMPVAVISFRGNSDKKPNQFASIAAELKGIGLDNIYSQGGEAVVTMEASNNWSKKAGADVRTFIAYHTADNYEGKVEYPGGFTVAKTGSDGKPAFRNENHNYKLKEGEKFVVKDASSAAYGELEELDISGSFKSMSEQKFAEEEVPYRLFKLKGTGGDKTPTVYVMHTPQTATFSKSYDTGRKEINGVKIPPKNGVYGGHKDLAYANFTRAVAEALPKLNDEKHGNYNPANIWLHDRQAFAFSVHAADKSAKGEDYFNGLKIDERYHNPGRGYQGFYDNPMDFFKIVANDEDIAALKKHSDYSFVQQMAIKAQSKKDDHEKQKEIEKKANGGNLVKLKEHLSFEELHTTEEIKKLRDIFDPVIGGFKDDKGTYNMCMIPVHAVKTNADNFSAGTVSVNYGKEMKNLETSEIAEGLTKSLASIETKDIVNGSTPANMETDKISAFGKPNNGLNKLHQPLRDHLEKNKGVSEEDALKELAKTHPDFKSGFTPFKPVVEAGKVKNIDEVYKAKQANKKWIINLVASATKESKKPENKGALNKLFFNDTQIASGLHVLGGLSEHKEGDLLYMAWGRPDAQKGFPTLLESALHFYKRTDVEDADKKKVKILFGSGPDAWNEGNSEWKKIQKQMSEIDKLGFGENVCYTNGMFPSRLVNCADWTDFTSRYEPCGITPLESFASGTPVMSIKTGGAPDFVRAYEGGDIGNSNGLLSKHAYLVNPEVIGADKSLTGEALDDARRNVLASEMSDLLKQSVEISKNEVDYKKMQNNSLMEKIDWHENSAYNGGKTANERYFEDVFGLKSDLSGFGKERNKNPLKSLKGKFAEIANNIKDNANQAAQNLVDGNAGNSGGEKVIDTAAKKMSTGAKVGIGAGIVAVAGGLAIYFSNKSKAKVPQSGDTFQSTTGSSGKKGKVIHNGASNKKRQKTVA